MLKKSFAIILSVVMLFGFASCGNTSWVVKTENNTVTSGLYLGYLVEQTIAQLQGQNASSVDDLLKMTVEEKIMPDYIKEKVLLNSKKYLAVEEKFTELGLALTEEDLATVNSTLTSYTSYYGDFFENNGCSNASLKELLTNNLKADRLFNYYYGEGGEKEVKKEDLKSYFAENYALCRLISFSTVDSSTGEDLADEELEKVKTTADEYLKRAQNGEDFITLAEEYKTAQGEEIEADAKEEGDDGLTDYDYIVNIESTTYDEDFVKEVFAMEKDAVKLVTTDNTIYLVLKKDVLENEKTYDAYSSGLLSNMKGSEFDETIEGWTESMTFTVNDSAVKRYAPKKIKII